MDLLLILQRYAIDTDLHYINHKKVEEIFSPTLTQANILGLGWAATPAGLKAMEELKKVEEERRKGGAAGRKDTPGQEDTAGRKDTPGQEETAGQRAAARQAGTASNEMCTFLIINISSLQLIPMNMIAYRSQYGSVNPTAIVGPALAATFISTVVAVIFCRIMDR